MRWRMAAIMVFIFALNPLSKQDMRLPGFWLFLEPLM